MPVTQIVLGLIQIPTLINDEHQAANIYLLVMPLKFVVCTEYLQIIL